jgi:hypothetical protein
MQQRTNEYTKERVSQNITNPVPNPEKTTAIRNDASSRRSSPPMLLFASPLVESETKCKTLWSTLRFARPTKRKINEPLLRASRKRNQNKYERDYARDTDHDSGKRKIRQRREEKKQGQRHDNNSDDYRDLPQHPRTQYPGPNFQSKHR